MYSIAELATARQHDADVTWLIVDDGGYGILREYMTDTFGRPPPPSSPGPTSSPWQPVSASPHTPPPPRPSATSSRPPSTTDGPAVVVLPALLRMFAPTHL